MEYIVIDTETGIDISEKVKVIRKTLNDYKYCRLMADEFFGKADSFWETKIQPLFDKRLNTTMDDFGVEFDPKRAEKWSNFMDETRAEIDELKRQWNAIIEIAGDWEDKEYAARFIRVIDFVAMYGESPLLEKEWKLSTWKSYLEHIGMGNMGKYLC